MLLFLPRYLHLTTPVLCCSISLVWLSTYCSLLATRHLTLCSSNLSVVSDSQSSPESLMHPASLRAFTISARSIACPFSTVAVPTSLSAPSLSFIPTCPGTNMQWISVSLDLLRDSNLYFQTHPGSIFLMISLETHA